MIYVGRKGYSWGQKGHNIGQYMTRDTLCMIPSMAYAVHHIGHICNVRYSKIPSPFVMNGVIKRNSDWMNFERNDIHVYTYTWMHIMQENVW